MLSKDILIKQNLQYKKLVEFNSFENVTLGDTLTSELFEEGDFVEVVGTSKGKGFQGVVKRHGFAGVNDATHGQHNRQRHPGSIGGLPTLQECLRE